MSDKPIILIVDDASRLNGSAMFGSEYRICRADNRASALALIKDEPNLGIAIINLEASAEDSLALVSTLRARQHAGIPVIGLCLNPDDHPAIEYELESVEEFIIRPIHLPLLAHHVRKLQKLHAYRIRSAGSAGAYPFDSLIDTLSTGVGVFEYVDEALHTLFVNQAFLRVADTYIDVSELYSEDALRMLHPQEAEVVRQAIEGHLHNGALIDMPLRVCGPDGHETSLRVQALPIHYPGRNSPVFLVSFTDISTQYRTEKALQESNSKLASLMNAVPGGIAVYDLSFTPKLIYANEMLATMSGYPMEEYEQLMQQDYHLLVDPRDHALLDGLIASFREQPQCLEESIRILTRNGEVRWIHISIAPFGEGPLCNAVFIDITHDREIETKNDRMRSELYYRAEFDVLTGINNRESFYRKTTDLLHENNDIPYVMLAIDIDRFKVVNDLFGKEVGDRILVAIGHGLKYLLNGIGTCARMEADHFSACFPQRLLDMDRILRLFEIGLKRQKIDYHIQLSFGIYQIRNINVPVNHMCDRAVMALKTIKGSVVEHYAFYDDKLRQTLLDENTILNEMNSALEQGQFVPYLQPVFAIDSNQPVSAEVLVRWIHPTKGVILPAQFIPLFERNGFITRLDFHIWEEACAMLARWKAVGYSLPVSVNISRIDLYSPRLCEHLMELTLKYDVSPSLLRLEITESAYSKDPEELVTIIDQLHAKGFMILMDDFGSGYSSLNVLMDMPVDMLKLDMRFLTKLDTNPRAASILTSVVRMAKWLHMPVVAEGVATQAQLAFLRSIGCDNVQGYLFARPMSVDDYTARYLSPEGITLEPLAPVLRESVDQACLWDVSAQVDAMFNGMIGGMGIYELCGDVLEVRRVNDGYYELFGCTPKQVFDGEQEALINVHPDDRTGLLQACRKAAQSGRVERCVCRHIHHRNGRQAWLEARLRFLGKAGENDVFCFTFTDVTEQKEFEQSRALRNYAIILRSVYSNVLELNLTKSDYHVVCTPEGQVATDMQELPLDGLLAKYRLAQDDELSQLVLQSGCLRQKLLDTQRNYYTLERKVNARNGQRRWSSFTFIRLPTESADEVYLLCIADVDSRKNAEELLLQNQFLQLKQQEQSRYQELLEHLGTSLVETDLQSGRVISSKGFENYAISAFDFRLLTSYKDVECYIYPQDLGLFRHFITDLLAHGNSTVTLRMLEKDGHAVWCRLLCSIVADEAGHATRCIAAVNQIDEQVKMRESYLDDQTRFHAFADNFLVGLGIFEMQGEEQHILYLSSGYRKMIGYADGEAFYDEDHSFSRVHPDDVPRFIAATRELVHTGKPYTIEYRVFHKSGRVQWMRSLNTVYPGLVSGTIRIFAVIEDITELKAVSNQLNTLMDSLPFGIGVYDITATPQICFENHRMAEMLSGVHDEPVQAGVSEQPAHTPEQILANIAQRSRQGHMESDERITVLKPNGKTVRVRMLSATAAREDALNCYCAMIEERATATGSPAHTGGDNA